MRVLAFVCLAALAAGCTLGPQARAIPYFTEVLEGAPFMSLVVEIDYAPGHAPSDAAVTHLVDTLQNVTRKGDITVDAQQTLPDTPGQSWSVDALVKLEASSRRHAHAAPVALLHVLYPSGLFNGSVDVQGITISGPTLGPVTVFLDAIHQVDTGTPLPLLPAPAQEVALLERHTLLHEAGHAMGLVDNGLAPMRDHEDKAHPGHSSSKQSIMYWATDSVSATRQLLLQDGSVADTFDNDDLLDLKSGGGK